jgi:hypothetical protein
VVEPSTLKHDEPVRLDPERLAMLFRQLGPAGAENVIARAMEELGHRLAELAPLRRDGRLGDLSRRARSLIAIAEQIGLASFARVSGDVAICAARSDEPALAATLARLERIADRSLLAIWDMQDIRV